MQDQFDEILEKHAFWDTLRLTALINRFATNCQAKKAEKIKGPEEIRIRSDGGSRDFKQRMRAQRDSKVNSRD